MIELSIFLAVSALGAVAMNAAAKRRRKANRLSREQTQNETRATADHHELSVGDVLLYENEELWLAGVFEICEEDTFILRLFSTPGSKTTWLAQLDPMAQTLAILSPCADMPGGPLPERLPLAGLTHRLQKQGQATIKAKGGYLPAAAETASYATLTAPGSFAVLLQFEEQGRLALQGRTLTADRVDILPGS